MEDGRETEDRRPKTGDGKRRGKARSRKVGKQKAGFVHN